MTEEIKKSSSKKTKKKWSKKKWLTAGIISVLGSILLAVSFTLFLTQNNKQAGSILDHSTKVEESQSSVKESETDYKDPEISIPSSPPPSSAPSSDFNLSEIAEENFTSLQGNWQNRDNSRGGVISGKSIILGGQMFFLSLAGYNPMNDLPYLTLHTIDDTLMIGMPLLAIYPAGTPIPVATLDGGTDTSGKFDPTDSSRDRILFAQGVLSPEETFTSVLYRD